MKYGVLTVTIAAAVALLGLSALAQGTGATGFANASTYLHAGPGQDFPVVAHIPPGADMTIAGCSEAYIWCDVTWNGNRGWIAGRFLDSVFQEKHVNILEYGGAVAVPIEAFDQRSYWRHNYRSYPFYASPRYWSWIRETPAETTAARYNPVDE